MTEKSVSSKTIKDITESGSLALLKQEIDRLKTLTESQQEYIGQLLNTLDVKEREILALQNNTTPDKIIISDEEQIAAGQLRLLKQKAESGELTLDDIKRFDILVKNKRIAQGSSPTIDVNHNVLDTISTVDLLKIATGKKI